MAEIIVSRRVWQARNRARYLAGRSIRSAEQSARNRRHPKMVLTCGTLKLTLPYAPSNSTTTGFGATWVEVPRPGRKPLLLRTAPKLVVQQWALYFGTQDLNADIGPQLNVLSKMATSLTPISITRGPGGTQRWHITEMSIEYLNRAQQTNHASRAIATITITESSELAPAPGPVAGGVKAPTPAKPAPKPAAKPPAKPAVRVHTVVRGETLGIISNRYYKTPSRWKVIADANRLRNANLIYPGQKLRIP